MPTTSTATITLTVTYANGTLSITGGNGDTGADVNVVYDVTETIIWQRASGQTFTFTNIAFAPQGNYTCPLTTVIASDCTKITVTDPDNNTTGQDQSFKYTITYKTSDGVTKTYDPKVLNRAKAGLGR